jgi:hypothetical protein
MPILSDAVQAYEQELLHKADMLAMALTGLHARAPERAAVLFDQITTCLAQAVSATSAAAASLEDKTVTTATALSRDSEDGRADDATRSETRRPAALVIAARGSGDEIEDFILEVLAAHPPGLSVQDIVDSLDDAQLEIKRKTLVVRLHRMVQAGRLAPQGHGNYTLSEAERSRRRA